MLGLHMIVIEPSQHMSSQINIQNECFCG